LGKGGLAWGEREKGGKSKKKGGAPGMPRRACRRRRKPSLSLLTGEEKKCRGGEKTKKRGNLSPARN